MAPDPGISGNPSERVSHNLLNKQAAILMQVEGMEGITAPPCKKAVRPKKSPGMGVEKHEDNKGYQPLLWED
jgi:hypothetical protein